MVYYVLQHWHSLSHTPLRWWGSIISITTLCTEFSDIFSNDLPKDSANISPFKSIVDDTKRKVGKNRAPPRFQSSVKQTTLFKTIQTLISQGIVEKSQSPHYSQILMVPKPDGTFRMCVDYRALSDCTAHASWPIPSIAEMLRKIGSQKPNIFGIITTALWPETGFIILLRNHGHCSTYRTHLYDLWNVHRWLHCFWRY